MKKLLKKIRMFFGIGLTPEEKEEMIQIAKEYAQTHNQMERLTIKELSPYLPYGLQLAYIERGKIIKIDTLRNLSDIKNYDEIKLSIGYFDSEHIWMFKPLLRPLSSLTEEIEHNSISIQLEPNLEKVKPSELIYKHWFHTIREDGHFSYHIGDGTVIGSLYSSVPYSLIELLLEWHFDVFGLIDRGLALPIEGKEVEGE